MTHETGARRARRGLMALALLAGTLLLSGCYETEADLIAVGDQAKIVGHHACTLQIGDKSDFDLNITDNGDGSYHFGAPDVTGMVKLKKLAADRYLMQLGDDQKVGTWYYAFAEPAVGGGFNAFTPKRDDAELSAAATQKYGIRFLDALDHNDPKGSTIKGSADNLMQFLSDPAMQPLEPWFTCKGA